MRNAAGGGPKASRVLQSAILSPPQAAMCNSESVRNTPQSATRIPLQSRTRNLDFAKVAIRSLQSTIHNLQSQFGFNPLARH
eukprot:6554516-Alexandrium_andersonii.AAC.1